MDQLQSNLLIVPGAFGIPIATGYVAAELLGGSDQSTTDKVTHGTIIGAVMFLGVAAVVLLLSSCLNFEMLAGREITFTIFILLVMGFLEVILYLGRSRRLLKSQQQRLKTGRPGPRRRWRPSGIATQMSSFAFP